MEEKIDILEHLKSETPEQKDGSIRFYLKLSYWDLELTATDLFYDPRLLEDKRDEYEKNERLKNLFYYFMHEHDEKLNWDHLYNSDGLTQILDWQYLYDNGKLCDHDFSEDWFKDELDKLGFTKEKYHEDFDLKCKLKRSKKDEEPLQG
jgi:hypothetical protein